MSVVAPARRAKLRQRLVRVGGDTIPVDITGRRGTTFEVRLPAAS